jgi:hypothetical protein
MDDQAQKIVFYCMEHITVDILCGLRKIKMIKGFQVKSNCLYHSIYISTRANKKLL